MYTIVCLDRVFPPYCILGRSIVLLVLSALGFVGLTGSGPSIYTPIPTLPQPSHTAPSHCLFRHLPKHTWPPFTIYTRDSVMNSPHPPIYPLLYILYTATPAITAPSTQHLSVQYPLLATTITVMPVGTLHWHTPFDLLGHSQTPHNSH